MLSRLYSCAVRVIVDAFDIMARFIRWGLPSRARYRLAVTMHKFSGACATPERKELSAQGRASPV